MEFSEIFGFLKILGESIKLVLRNLKLIASITTISLLLSSIVFLLFSFTYQAATTYMTDTIMNFTSGAAIFFLQSIFFNVLPFAVEFAFMFSYISIAHVSGIATVLTAATSYTDTKLSLPDLFSAVRTKWRSPFRFRKNISRVSPHSMYLLSIIAVAVAVPVVMFYPNPVTIAIAGVAGVSIVLFHLYASVVPALAAVIPVMEDGCEVAEAVEKAEKLVEGRRLHGFMVNLFINVLCLIVFLSFWIIVGDKGSLNITVYGLFFIDCASAAKIFMDVVYTVYYFRCKEYHGEQIQLLWNFDYTKLMNDIP